MKYKVRLEFHTDDDNGLRLAVYVVTTESWESAFKAALSLKDLDWPEKQLKDVHVFLDE